MRRTDMRDLEIRTIWRTAAEHCELVWSQLNGYRVRLWVQNRLILEEVLGDADGAFRRAWELRVEWPRLIE
jgi:hypothetical protein